MKNSISEPTKKQISLEIDQSENVHQKFKGIHTGNNPEVIVIIIDTSQETDTVFVWDVHHDVEMHSIDVGNNYEIIWDSQGKPHILTPECFIDHDMLRLKQFTLNKAIVKAPMNNLRNYRGHRFDWRNKNWFIIKEHLSLAFSYMSFVIKEKIEKNDPHQKLNYWDIESYNYIFNQRTCFLDSNLVTTDYQTLVKVLEKFEKIDPELLDLLAVDQHYFNSETKSLKIITPLNKALAAGNNRIINLILHYLSKMKKDTSTKHREIFDKLIEHSAFKEYLASLPIQTV